MGKVIKLTESDLIRLVKRVIKEDESQSAEKMSIMSAVSDLDLSDTGIDINSYVEMGFSDDETPKEINPQLEGKEFSMFQTVKKKIVDDVIAMCQSGKNTNDIISKLKRMYNEYKMKHNKQVSEQMQLSQSQFYLAAAAIVGITALICFIIIKLKNRDGCAKFAKWRNKTFTGYNY